MANQNLVSYELAFSRYLEGHPLEDIAKQLEIPLDVLQHRSWQHGWRAMALRFHEVAKTVNVLPTFRLTTEHLELNRKANYEQAKRLRVQSDKFLKQMEDTGTLLTPKAFRDLVAAIATIHDLTYRALGDVPAKKDANQPDRPASAQIHVHLPAAIASPRSGARTIDIKANADVPESAGVLDASDAAKPPTP